jgi:hypothetical protein
MDINEKIDRIAKLLGICPVCFSGYINSDKEWWNEYVEIKCTSCKQGPRVKNPNYRPPDEKMMAKKNDSDDDPPSEGIEPFMEW